MSLDELKILASQFRAVADDPVAARNWPTRRLRPIPAARSSRIVPRISSIQLQDSHINNIAASINRRRSVRSPVLMERS